MKWLLMCLSKEISTIMGQKTSKQDKSIFDQNSVNLFLHLLQSSFSPYTGKRKPIVTTTPHTPQWSDYWCVCQRKCATMGQKTSKQDNLIFDHNSSVNMHLLQSSSFSPYTAGKKKPVTTTPHTPQWSAYWCVCQRTYAMYNGSEDVQTGQIDFRPQFGQHALTIVVLAVCCW
jgi:hypothetical protein